MSDTFQTNDKDLEEVKAGMKKLGIDTLAQQAGKDGKNFILFFYFSAYGNQTQLSPGLLIWIGIANFSHSHLMNFID